VGQAFRGLAKNASRATIERVSKSHLFGMFRNPGFRFWAAVGSNVLGRAATWQKRGLRRASAADERGVALIEFALVLPMVLLLLLGMIDVGKAINYWNDETHLANEASRAVAVNNSPDPNWATNKTTAAYKINTAVRNQADSNELKNGGTHSISSPGVSMCIWFPNGTRGVPPTSSAWAVGQPVQVVVKAQYNWLAYLIGKGLPAHSDLTATSTMRIEQQPTNPTSPTSTDAYIASSNNSC
jgi:Flp pilus assembly protein TadG